MTQDAVAHASVISELHCPAATTAAVLTTDRANHCPAATTAAVLTTDTANPINSCSVAVGSPTNVVNDCFFCYFGHNCLEQIVVFDIRLCTTFNILLIFH